MPAVASGAAGHTTDAAASAPAAATGAADTAAGNARTSLRSAVAQRSTAAASAATATIAIADAAADAAREPAGAAAGRPALPAVEAPTSAVASATVATPAAHASAGAAPAAAATAPSWSGALAASIDSPAFAPALGARLVTLLRGGVEHARLQLHPAELGPILVQISVDGSSAQIDFAAAHAATRDALQEAVPTLASALRDAGLSLAGGGVFDRPREAPADPGAQPRQQATAGAASTSAQPVAAGASGRLQQARGVLDLYA